MCSHPENTRPLEQKSGEGEICVALVCGNGGRGSFPTHKHPVAIRKKIAQKYMERINAVVEIFV
jgi:hypothetical protein